MLDQDQVEAAPQVDVAGPAQTAQAVVPDDLALDQLPRGMHQRQAGGHRQPICELGHIGAGAILVYAPQIPLNLPFEPLDECPVEPVGEFRPPFFPERLGEQIGEEILRLGPLLGAEGRTPGEQVGDGGRGPVEQGLAPTHEGVG